MRRPALQSTEFDRLVAWKKNLVIRRQKRKRIRQLCDGSAADVIPQDWERETGDSSAMDHSWPNPNNGQIGITFFFIRRLDAKAETRYSPLTSLGSRNHLDQGSVYLPSGARKTLKVLSCVYRRCCARSSIGRVAAVSRSVSEGGSSPGNTTSQRPFSRPVPLYAMCALIAGTVSSTLSNRIGFSTAKESFTSVNENGVRGPPLTCGR